MKVSASIKSNFNHHEVVLKTDEKAKPIKIDPKYACYGSSINGGDLLLLSLYTCFYKDFYKEAGKKNIAVSGVEALFKGEFTAEGELGTNFFCSAILSSDASEAEIQDLIASTYRVAEIHNTLRNGVPALLHNETQSLD